MAHSLEARCPILDHRVVELAAMQPSARHGERTTTKRLFREVIAPWVPADVLIAAETRLRRAAAPLVP